MTREEMESLAVGDRVRVLKSGKVYEKEKYFGDFIMLRNGKPYGPVRDLKPENVERVLEPRPPNRNE